MTDHEQSITYDEAQAIMREMSKGHEIFCEVCQQPLQLKLPGSGYHPGIFCGNGCTQIWIEMGVKA